MITMGYDLKRTWVSLTDLKPIQDFLSVNGYGSYEEGVFSAMRDWCKKEHKECALVNIRINCSSSGPRWHIDWIPLGIEGITSCIKYAITLEWPWTLLCEKLKDGIYSKAMEIQRELSSNYWNEAEENRIQNELNQLFEWITKQTKVWELISWKIWVGADFHSEPEIAVDTPRVFLQFIPY